MSLLASTLTLHPVLHSEHTPSVDLRYQTRCLYRKSLLPRAPTGQRSTTFPASLFSSGRPGKTSISSWWPRLVTINSAVPLISRVNRTRRVHMMQRSVNSVIVLESCGLFGGVFFTSTIRDSDRPYLYEKSCSLHSPALSHTGQSSGWLMSRPSSVSACAFLA